MKWPVLLNQVEDHGHFIEEINFTGVIDEKYRDRVTLEERSPYGWGVSAMISHDDLLLKNYLTDDCLKFCVKVEAKHD